MYIDAPGIDLNGVEEQTAAVLMAIVADDLKGAPRFVSVREIAAKEKGTMIYKVTLNGRLYEVEVENGEAVMLGVTDTAAVTAEAQPEPVRVYAPVYEPEPEYKPIPEPEPVNEFNSSMYYPYEGALRDPPTH